jgi:DNA repair protein RecO (recombination protein O)
MPTRDDEAFVLTRYPYRERDLIVVLLTRQSGQLRVLARRARGARSPVAVSLEPLARIHVSYHASQRSALATLNEASPLRPSFELASRPVSWAAAQVVAELALLYCPEGESAERAFRLVGHGVDRLLAGGDPLVVAAYVELWFLRLAGVFPELARCGVCGASLAAGPRLFDPRESRFVCELHPVPPRAMRLTAPATRWLAEASSEPVERVGERAPQAVLDWLWSLRREFTERDVSSWRFLLRAAAEEAERQGRG